MGAAAATTAARRAAPSVRAPAPPLAPGLLPAELGPQGGVAQRLDAVERERDGPSATPLAFACLAESSASRPDAVSVARKARRWVPSTTSAPNAVPRKTSVASSA
ncbi:hypothetical protein ACFQQB_17270 [Nonomuraea rubra]|uniref:hypothetical protein n=1 Tax=Nonomuraea rubra TaxID=46180 RepID=UPI00360DDD7C